MTTTDKNEAANLRLEIDNLLLRMSRNQADRNALEDEFRRMQKRSAFLHSYLASIEGAS